MSVQVDLNCDLGESFGAWAMGRDDEVMTHISSANVACGFHASDPGTMRLTVRLASERGVAIGAHPGLPDLVGFGRRAIAVAPEEAYEFTLYQIGALDAFVRAAGARLQHVKPHGALYTMAARDGALADALVAATRDARADLIFVGQPDSELERAARHARVRFAAEVFADRTYQADGSLTPRGRADALVTEPEAAVAQVLAMVTEGRVRACGGEWIAVRADTVCVHGDNPEAVAFTSRVRRGLEQAGVAIAPLAAWLP
ncbi:MAG: LamB/YcsF family protein [Acidobacteriota bacterium]